MGVARICGTFWTHHKRLHLERLLAGTNWPRLGPRCGGEMCARILAWLDSLDDTSGKIPDIEQMADVAGWPFDPSELMQALVTAELVEVHDGVHYWHDFSALNGSAIRQRNYRRNALRNGPHNASRNEIRGSGSGSGSGTGEGTNAVPDSPPESPRRSAKQTDLLAKQKAEEDREWCIGVARWWNELAKRRPGLPTVVEKTAWSNREKRKRILAFREDVRGDSELAGAAMRLAADQYEGMTGPARSLWNMIWAENRRRWIAQAEDDR